MRLSHLVIAPFAAIIATCNVVASKPKTLADIGVSNFTLVLPFTYAKIVGDMEITLIADTIKNIKPGEDVSYAVDIGQLMSTSSLWPDPDQEGENNVEQKSLAKQPKSF